MTLKLLTEHHLEFLIFKGGCTGSPESTHVKMPHCWKSHVAAHFYYLLVTQIWIKHGHFDLCFGDLDLIFKVTASKIAQI